jgi:exopolyphosphatase/guanosine-5'-triphosphate,3'-diphosphate pyrophosphatase
MTYSLDGSHLFLAGKKEQTGEIHMMTSFPTEELQWWQSPEPTAEELYLSGGLQVEDWPHARQVERLANELFSSTQILHRQDESARLLLTRAAFLHNTGMLVEVRRHHKHSYRLIKEAPLPGFTEKERHEIACIARYHRRAMPSTVHEEFALLNPKARKRVSMLAALLRIADALDFNHDGRVLHLSTLEEFCEATTWTIGLQMRRLADPDLEIEHAYAKADLFERVFKRKLRLLVQE